MPRPPKAISWKSQQAALEKWRENDFIGADPHIVRQALCWVQTHDVGTAASESGVSEQDLIRNMTSPLFMALVDHIKSKIAQPDIVGRAWVQAKLLELERQVDVGAVDEKGVRAKLSIYRVMLSTLPKKEQVDVSHHHFSDKSKVIIDSLNFEEEDGGAMAPSEEMPI